MEMVTKAPAPKTGINVEPVPMQRSEVNSTCLSYQIA